MYGRTNYLNSYCDLHLRTFACLNLIRFTYTDAALGAVTRKDMPSLIFRNYCRRREDGRSENAPRRPFRTVVLAPGMQIIVRRGMCVCVRACARSGKTDPRMQIEPTSHDSRRERAGWFVRWCGYIRLCMCTHPDYPICRLIQGNPYIRCKGECIRNE